MTGRGDYTATNSLITSGDNSVVPRFAGHTDAVTISNVEYVRDIYAPGSVQPFSVSTLSINPGLPVAFPWLSQVAANYQEFELVQCIYTFKSTIADFAAASGQVGQIVMATQYNSSLEAFADKETMMMYEGSMSCKSSSSMLHGVECDPTKLAATTGRKYVRTGSLASNQDLNEYDQGVLNIAILNPPATYLGQVMGELWVSYTIVLRKPRLSALNGNNIPTDLFAYYNQAGTVAVTGTLAQADALQLCGPRNSFGGQLYASNVQLPYTQPAAVYVNGVPAVGSTLDPIDIFANETPFNPYVGGVYATAVAGNPWYYGSTPTTNLFVTGYCYEFPDNFQGLAELVFFMFGRAGGGTLDPECTQLFQPVTAGNVYRFKDIPERDSPTLYTVRYSACTRINNNVVNAVAPTDYDNSGITVTCHVRVQPATNGLKNRMYFGQLSTAVNPLTQWTPAVTELCVRVYNATNSQSLTGKADRLALQYSQTGLPYTTI